MSDAKSSTIDVKSSTVPSPESESESEWTYVRVTAASLTAKEEISTASLLSIMADTTAFTASMWDQFGTVLQSHAKRVRALRIFVPPLATAKATDSGAGAAASTASGFANGFISLVNLKVLSLENAARAPAPELLTALGRLERLMVTGPIGVVLSPFIQGLKSIASLHEIALHNCRLSDTETIELAALVECGRLRWLELMCEFENPTVVDRAIVPALCSPRVTLHALDLMGAAITPLMMSALKPNKQLRRLRLYHPPPSFPGTTASGIVNIIGSIADVCRSGAPSLREFMLLLHHNDQSECASIFDALTQHNTVESIHMTAAMSAATLRAVGLMVQTNVVVTDLSVFNHTNQSVPDIKEMCAAIAHQNRVLQSFEFQAQRMGVNPPNVDAQLARAIRMQRSIRSAGGRAHVDVKSACIANQQLYENWIRVAPLLACKRDLHPNPLLDSIFDLLPIIRGFVTDYASEPHEPTMKVIHLDHFCKTKFALSVIHNSPPPAVSAATAAAAALPLPIHPISILPQPQPH